MNYLFLTKTAFFNGLSENEIKTILNCLGAYQKSFKKSEIIYYSGDTVSDMGLVLSGSVLSSTIIGVAVIYSTT